MIIYDLFFLELIQQLILILCSDWLRYYSLIFTFRLVLDVFLSLSDIPLSTACYHSLGGIFTLFLLLEVELIVLLVHSDGHEAFIEVSSELIIFLLYIK